MLAGAAVAAPPSRLDDSLFLSGAVEAASLHLLRHLGVTHILNATQVLPPHCRRGTPRSEESGDGQHARHPPVVGPGRFKVLKTVSQQVPDHLVSLLHAGYWCRQGIYSSGHWYLRASIGVLWSRTCCSRKRPRASSACGAR